MNHPHESQAAAMDRAGELPDGEQLRECINSGQVSAAQVVAHAENGELSMSMFVDRKGYEQYLTTRLKAALQDRDEWKDATLSANERFKKAEKALAAEREKVRILREALELVHKTLNSPGNWAAAVRTALAATQQGANHE